MPLTHVMLMKRRHPESRQKALLSNIYQAMRETFEVPEDDCFMMLHEVEPWQLRYGRTYLGFERSDDLVIIQVTCNAGRQSEVKKAFYARIVELVCGEGDVRPDDVFINLIETNRENWSFGAGLAQYA